MWKPEPSFWEVEVLQRADVLIIGAGFTGLYTALNVKQLHPDWDVKVIDRAPFSAGASTRNAGFACFANPTELWNDVESMGEEEAVALTKHRYEGLKQLKSWFAPDSIGWSNEFSGELFWDGVRAEPTFQRLKDLNRLLELVTGESGVFHKTEVNGFPAVQNRLEGGLNTGMLVQELHKKCRLMDIAVIGGVEVTEILKQEPAVLVRTKSGNWHANQVIVTTNALYPTPYSDLQAVRNAVLVSQPIDHSWTGTFSAEGGYYYWRDVTDHNGGKRLLIGGGRHLFRETETTNAFGVLEEVKTHLEEVAQRQLGVSTFRTDMAWSGILGVGKHTKGLPIVEEHQPGIFYGIRLGGMGVALSAGVGRQLASLLVGCPS